MPQENGKDILQDVCIFTNLNHTLQFPNFPDEIVSDGDKPMPCNPSTPETAPMGAYLCDANTSICLEKWSVSGTCKSSAP